MKFYLLFSVLFASGCYGHEEEKQNKNAIKDMIVHEIMKKVSNITLSTLSNVPNDTKVVLLNKMEQKVNKLASEIPDGDKYVKIIMSEFKKRAFHVGNHENTDNTTNHLRKQKHLKKDSVDNNRLRTYKKSDGLTTNKKTIAQKVYDSDAQQIIKDVSDKIEAMAKEYLKDSQTLDEQKQILYKIKGRILDVSKQKHTQLHSQHTKLKVYNDLITKGLELSISKLLHSQSRRAENSEITESKAQKVDLKQKTNDNNALRNIDNVNDYKIFFSEIWNETSIDPRCNDEIEDICLRVESLRKLKCGDGKTVSIKQLCDGVSDCWNNVDETDCIYLGTERIKRAVSLIADVEHSITSKCLTPMIDKAIFSHHHEVVQNMLKSQLSYLQNSSSVKEAVADVQEASLFKQDFEKDQGLDLSAGLISRAIADVTMTVNSLSDIFEGNLCLPHVDVSINKAANLTRRTGMNESDLNEFTDDEDEEVPEEPKSYWSPKLCTCAKQYCKSVGCDTRCKRICWQKYSLNHFVCQSKAGDGVISFDLICDGKLDCFDESDETSCTTDPSMTKFEANNLYKHLLEQVSTKTLSNEYEKSRNKIVALSGLIRQLQNITVKPNANVHTIRKLRTEYFKLLARIYGDKLKISNLEELDHAYDFLHILNKQMVYALKSSHTGNEQVVAPAGCYCSNGTCVLVRCPKKCISTCLVEPTIINYSCKDNSTSSVNIRDVCNGKKDCSNGEDEKDCLQEACRTHHLVLLHRTLQQTGEAWKGTVIGGILDGWKSKVMSSLVVAENKERPSRKVIVAIISTILHDLVTAYASVVEAKKHGSERVLKLFIEMAQIVKQTLKSCGQ